MNGVKKTILNDFLVPLGEERYRESSGTKLVVDMGTLAAQSVCPVILLRSRE